MKINLNHQSNKLKPYNVEILSIGTELLLGDIVNTNSQWIAIELSHLGLNHFRQSTIGDNKSRISNIVKEISVRSDLLITTGGLGPTPDDLTTEAIADAFNAEISEREYLWDEIKRKISRNDLDINNSNLKKQCIFPKDAEIINNPNGTAPGMIWHPKEGFTIMTFPGVPNELKSMWRSTANEYIRKNFSNNKIFLSSTLKFCGISESTMSERIENFLNLENPTVAPYANLGEVKLRITAKAKNKNEAENLINPIKEKLKDKFSQYIYGEDEDTLASTVLRIMGMRKESLGIAESCTGGLLSSSITSIPGSSNVFKGGIVAYTNELKESLIGVSNETINKFGAVSEETVKAMAIGVRQKLGSDWSIAISGIAGPQGGSRNKPVGLVYIAISAPNKEIFITKKLFNPIRNRQEIQILSVNECLNQLRLILLS